MFGLIPARRNIMKKARILFGVMGAAPIALAATATPALATAAAPMGTTPIHEGACDANHATWFDLYTTYHGRVCYGFSGTIDPDMYAGTFCPGNNNGVLYYKSPQDRNWTDDFIPDEGWTPVGSSDLDYVSGLHISGWSVNNYGC
jgi:hypothetical protein